MTQISHSSRHRVWKLGGVEASAAKKEGPKLGPSHSFILKSLPLRVYVREPVSTNQLLMSPRVSGRVSWTVKFKRLQPVLPFWQQKQINASEPRESPRLRAQRVQN